MTASVMEGVNAVTTLERAHREHLLAPRALNERSLLIRGLSFPRTMMIGDVHIGDLVILGGLQSSDVHADSSPFEVQRADVLYDFLQLPTNAGKSGSTLAGEFWGVRLDGVSGTQGFPLALLLLLMLISMLVAAMGVNRMLLHRFLGGRAFALALRREVFASLDVSSNAATALPPCRRCRVKGDFIDELVLVTGPAQPAGGTLRKTLRYGCISEWRWRLRCAHHTRGLARRRKESTCALFGMAMNH